VCIAISDTAFLALDDEDQRAFVNDMARRLEQDRAAFDIAGHRGAPAGLRIWTGATVDAEDIAALLPWLDWAFDAVRRDRISS